MPSGSSGLARPLPLRLPCVASPGVRRSPYGPPSLPSASRASAGPNKLGLARPCPCAYSPGDTGGVPPGLGVALLLLRNSNSATRRVTSASPVPERSC
jgi:hypothetical protein